jgi:hypothetical protein
MTSTADLRAELDGPVVDVNHWPGVCHDWAIRALAALDEAERERDLATDHDRQPYPTAAAYEAVCETLHRRELEIAALAADYPEFDATDGAHPAWWRGDDHGYAKGIEAERDRLESLVLAEYERIGQQTPLSEHRFGMRESYRNVLVMLAPKAPAPIKEHAARGEGNAAPCRCADPTAPWHNEETT